MKFEFTKFGLKHNPIGAHVTLPYQGRTLLGEVVGFGRNERLGVVVLNVRHMNGEDWPIKPAAAVVEVLDRESAIAFGCL